MLKLKKSLGQHFLIDEHILQKISAHTQEENPDRVLEVGAGGGALTSRLLEISPIDLKAVEIDKEKARLLASIFAGKKAEIIASDILSIERPFDEPFWIVGNLPYYISSSILFKMLEWRECVSGAIFMLQKEVAERICSPHGSKRYGILSVLLQSYFEASYLFDVSPECFTPPPKVMSGVIKLKTKGNPFQGDATKLKRLTKIAFNQRRKMLRNSARSLFDEETLRSPLFTKRPEELPLSIFHQLVDKMK